MFSTKIGLCWNVSYCEVHTIVRTVWIPTDVGIFHSLLRFVVVADITTDATGAFHITQNHVGFSVSQAT